MTTADAAAPPLAIPAARAPARTPRAATVAALRAMVVRDLTVLDRNLQRFLPISIIQPALLVFVFAYLFPRMGQGIGGAGGAAMFSTLLLPGIVANSIMFVGIFSVGMNLTFEMEDDELEDRVLAPAPIATAAVAKIVAGALQALVAGLVVFPFAAFLPSTPIYLHIDWPVLATLVPLVCLTSASLGLALGVVFQSRSAPWLFSVVALPLSFFGAVFYTWGALQPVPVIQDAVLVNPLLFMSEGLRAATVAGVPHLPLAAVYPVLAGFALVFITVGVVGFRRRMLG